ncbi:MAG: 30S ribosomal protein S1 [Gammaproteobacteria bacterium]|nr:30S ribosomal protein S1 [Gammaproteobacteria bacterium]
MTEHEDFASLFGQFEREHAGPAKAVPKAGDRVRGRILSIGPERAFVDLGAKSEGVIEITDLTDADGHVTVAVGDSVDAMVLSRDDQSGTLLLGRGAGHRFHDSAELEQAFRGQLPVEGLVTGVTRGGLEVQVAGQRAFCPASQIDNRFVEDLQSFVGQRLTFRITRYQGGKRSNVVVSRRVLLEEEQKAKAEEMRARLEVGAVLRGTVTSIKDYGAFVDLGGVEGMVHVSELAHGRVAHPQDVLTVGQPVDVQVLRIEKTGNPKHPDRVALSVRALAADPWQEAVDRFPAGARVRGTVTRVQPFGAFVELAPGVEGLVHISELGAGRRISHPHEVVNPGDAVEATVLGVEPAKRRISLSLDASRKVDAADVEALARATQKPKAGDGVGSFGELLRETLNRAKPRS